MRYNHLLIYKGASAIREAITAANRYHRVYVLPAFGGLLQTAVNLPVEPIYGIITRQNDAPAMLQTSESVTIQALVKGQLYRMKSIPRGSNKAYVQLSFFDLPTKKHRICQICSVVFIPSSNSSGLYCSPRCGCAGRWINSHHCAYTHICKQCGKEFTKAYEASYCSPHCGAIGRRKEATGNCLYCDKEITFKLHSKRIYCSPQCRNRHLNKTLPRKTRSIWTPDQLAYLREHYLADGSNEVAIAVGKTHNQVVDKANKMKISNSRIGAISRLHRDRPSGYELSVRQALDSLNIAHDASVVIKDKFIVDIKIGNLIIEADGDYWHGHARFEPLTERQLSQQKRDIARNKYLLACGYGVERIWESDFSLDYLKAILHKHHII